MKKVFALVMAAAMVLSMSAISFADTPADLEVLDRMMKASEGVVNVSKDTANTNNSYSNIYYLLYSPSKTTDDAGSNYLTTADEIDGLKVKAEWEQNKDLVKDVKIVKKKWEDSYNNEGYAYFVEVSFNAQSTTSSYDVYGTLNLKDTSEDVDIDFDVFVTLQKGKSNNVTLSDSDKIYSFNEGGTNGALQYDEEQEFELYGGAGWFVVDTYGQGKILLSNTVDVAKRAEIEAKYPDVNFYYFNGNGATFNKLGQLKLVADEDSYLYKIGADGTTLTLVEDAEYDDVDECWVINTRVLGQYLIADHELEDITDVADPDEGATVTPPANVETGAAA